MGRLALQAVLPLFLPSRPPTTSHQPPCPSPPCPPGAPGPPPSDSPHRLLACRTSASTSPPPASPTAYSPAAPLPPHLPRHSSELGEVLAPEEVHLPNGMDWDEGKGLIYFVDSGSESIVAYQTDAQVGGWCGGPGAQVGGVWGGGCAGGRGVGGRGGGGCCALSCPPCTLPVPPVSM